MEPDPKPEEKKEEKNPRFIVDTAGRHYVDQKGSLRRVEILKQRKVKGKTLTDVAFVKRVRMSKKERLDARAKENGFLSHKDMLNHNNAQRESRSTKTLV